METTSAVATQTPSILANPEAQKKVAEMRARVQTAVGQVVLVLAGVPRYRHHSLADLQSLVLDPLMRDRIAIASAAQEDGSDVPGGQLAAIAYWASVSDDADVKIREQIKAGVFPVRLKPEEWNSGEHVWLLDVIAPSQKLASAVLANFQKVTKKDGAVHIHPVAARQVDPELLKKMGAPA